MCFMTKESSYCSKSIIKVPKSAIYKNVMKMWNFFCFPLHLSQLSTKKKFLGQMELCTCHPFIQNEIFCLWCSLANGKTKSHFKHSFFLSCLHAWLLYGFLLYQRSKKISRITEQNNHQTANTSSSYVLSSEHSLGDYFHSISS